MFRQPWLILLTVKGTGAQTLGGTLTLTGTLMDMPMGISIGRRLLD
jgi:hypothetical protein